MQKNQICDSDQLVTGEIIRVIPKESKYGKTYYDVHFKLLQSGSFLRSCVYTACRNFENWRYLLTPGNILGDLEIFETKWHKLFIDADSVPVLIRKGNPEVNQDLRPIRKTIIKKTQEVQEVLFQ